MDRGPHSIACPLPGAGGLPGAPQSQFSSLFSPLCPPPPQDLQQVMVSGPNLNETSIVSGGYGGTAEGIIPTSSIQGQSPGGQQGGHCSGRKKSPLDWPGLSQHGALVLQGSPPPSGGWARGRRMGQGELWGVTSRPLCQGGRKEGKKLAPGQPSTLRGAIPSLHHAPCPSVRPSIVAHLPPSPRVLPAPLPLHAHRGVPPALGPLHFRLSSSLSPTPRTTHLPQSVRCQPESPGGCCCCRPPLRYCPWWPLGGGGGILLGVQCGGWGIHS